MIFSGSSRLCKMLFRLDLATREKRSNRFMERAVVLLLEGDDRTGRATKLLRGTTLNAAAQVRKAVAVTNRTMVLLLLRMILKNVKTQNNEEALSLKQMKGVTFEGCCVGEGFVGLLSNSRATRQEGRCLAASFLPTRVGFEFVGFL
jgi:hypothetical protein